MEFMTKLVDMLEKTSFADIPKEVVERAKLLILDTLGVGIAGSSEAGCREIVEIAKGLGGKPEATVISYGVKVPSMWAVLANSTMMHALDFDDTLDASPLHANVSVLPTALAMAEAKGNVSGKDLLTAVVLGVDLACRVALATKSPIAFVRTVTCGSFGAAAAAAKIMNFDRAKIMNTIGIVYSQTSGNAQCLVDGGLVKRIQPAMAAKAAVLSALLAGSGITGARDVFEGEYGYFNLYERGNWNREPLFDGLGKRFELIKLSIKPYPSCRMTHAAIDSALDIRKEKVIDPDKIDKIVIYTSKMAKDVVGSPFEIRRNPQVDAQFSIPYTVSVALTRGDVFLSDFEDANIKDERVLKLAKKVEVVADSSIPERSMMDARIVIKTKQGMSYSKETLAPRGNPQRPLSIDECIAKFNKCIQYSGGKEIVKKREKLIDTVTHLEELKNIEAMTELLV